MRILIIGNSKSAEILTNFLSEDKNLLIFSTKENTLGNFINIATDNIEELKEFALANEINLTIVADISLFNLDYLSIFSTNNLAILMPDSEALKIASEKTFGKKFIYKNKIKTPKFAFFEKPALATEYVRNSAFPLVIKPDEHSDTETAYIAETFGAAKKQIEKLFQNSNKKILVEEYIFGKELTYYVLSDGFNPILAGCVQTFANELSFNTSNPKLDEKVYNEIIFPAISGLAETGCEYTGVLGFDIIVAPNEDVYLIECNPFFKDLDIEIILKSTDENWPKLFMDAIIGTLTENFESPFSIKRGDEYFGAFIDADGGEIITECAKTKNMLKTRLLEEGLKKETLDEAQKMWKL